MGKTKGHASRSSSTDSALYRTRSESRERHANASTNSRSDQAGRDPVGNEPQAQITDLPTEIFLQVAGHLDIRTACDVRRTSRYFRDAIDRYLQDRYSVLYLTPTERSMKRLLDICNNELYANHIAHLCILGEPMWDEIANQYPHHRRDSRKREMESVLKFGTWTDLPSHLFQAWPYRYGILESKLTSSAPMPSSKERSSKGDTASKKKTQKQHHQADMPLPDQLSDLDFETCYEPLIHALEKLKKLRKLSYMTTIKFPGLNVVAAEHFKSHLHGRLGGFAHHSANASISDRRSDAGVFYRLLANHKLHFEEVNLRVELPFCEDVLLHMPEYWLPDSENSLTSAFRKLTKLDLSVDCGWDETESTKMYKHLIRGSAPKLELLRIRLIYNPVGWRIFEQVDELLWDGVAPDNVPVKLPCLKHFEVIFVENPRVDNVLRDANGRWQRPPCITLRMKEFWEPYLPTLTHLRLQHVVNNDFNTHSIRTIHGSMREELNFLRQHPHKLEQFDWIVPAFRHHRLCTAHDSETDLVGEIDCMH